MIYTGTSGYSFKDWVGKVYPPDLAPSKMLGYYSRVWKFNALELNFTYYRMPSHRTVTGMLRKLDRELVFAVKAPGKVTHEFWKSPPLEGRLQTFSLEFYNALEPMRVEGKLGPILFQFPWSFKGVPKNRDYLERLADSFDCARRECAFEFRHSSWASEDTFELLECLSVTPVVVDEPALVGDLFPYLLREGRRNAYFRLHGRNKDWFKNTGANRYDYDYSDDELRSFALDVLKFHGQGLRVFVFFNNCYMGKAVHNALRFREMIGGA